MELRSLRKNAIELEEHSALLQNHVDNMESVVADLEQEVELTKENNEALERQFEPMAKLVVTQMACGIDHSAVVAGR